VTPRAPSAKTLARLSPSSFETLNACPLQLAFATQGSRAGAVPGDRQRIGQICHDVLESLVRDGQLRSSTWPASLEARFVELLARNQGAKGATVRGSRLAFARLRKVAGRMADLVQQLPADAEVLTEEELTAADGRLFGRLDLIVRSAGRHMIIDYKTGSFLEPGTAQLKATYERQLMLYAYLEAEASGSWPEEAVLVPFGAEPVTLNIDPNACQRLSQDVLAALDQWQAWIGRPPPANASTSTCRWCPFAARCPEFWAACNTSWSDDLLAMRGRVTSIATTPLGGVTLQIASTQGSVLGAVAVRNVEPAEFPGLMNMGVGDAIAIVGMRNDANERVFTTAPAARLSLD
jgi:RecB family exonuclease